MRWKDDGVKMVGRNNVSYALGSFDICSILHTH